MLYQDFRDSGKLADPDVWGRYYNAMKRPTTFEAMLNLWEEMAGWDLMSAALVDIVAEATQTDSNSPATLWYQCNDRDVEEELNQMLVTVEAERIIPSQVWHVAALGNNFDKIEYAPKQGVMGLNFVHPTDIRRYWLERNRKCVGFRWKGNIPRKDDVFVHPDNQSPVERVALSDGNDLEDLWYPWDFLHIRRMYRLRQFEHGEPIFGEADGIYKKLRLAVDQMVVHRALIQPDRYAVNIDVGEQTPAEQMKTVQKWKQALRSKLAFGAQAGPGTLGSPTEFSAYNNAMALDTILWVARPKGMTHAIDRLQGTQNIPDVYDIEFLTDLFYAIIGMPRSWFGGQKEGAEQAPSGKALLAQDMRFLRKIKSIRGPIQEAYTWLAYFHCVLKGYNVREIDIKTMMPPIGSLEEQMKLEMLQKQAEVLQMLADVMEAYALPKEAWIEVIFKRYMHLPDDVVNIFITALPAPKEPLQAESVIGRGKPAPAQYKIVREIEAALGKRPDARKILESLKDSVYGTDRERIVHYRVIKEAQQIFNMPTLQDNEFVVSSFGKNPFSYGKKSFTDSTVPKRAQPLMESKDSPSATQVPTGEAAPGWRQFMPSVMG
jgi:hypothetical protein